MEIPCPRCYGTDVIHCRICKGVGFLEDKQVDLDYEGICVCGEYTDIEGRCPICNLNGPQVVFFIKSTKDDDEG